MQRYFHPSTGSPGGSASVFISALLSRSHLLRTRGHGLLHKSSHWRVNSCTIFLMVTNVNLQFPIFQKGLSIERRERHLAEWRPGLLVTGCLLSIQVFWRPPGGKALPDSCAGAGSPPPSPRLPFARSASPNAEAMGLFAAIAALQADWRRLKDTFQGEFCLRTDLCKIINGATWLFIELEIKLDSRQSFLVHMGQR